MEWFRYVVKYSSFLIVGLAAFSNSVRCVNKYLPTWKSLDSRPLPEWYDDSKIGIFVHWGVYSVPAFRSEWFWYYWKQEHQLDCEQYVRDKFGNHIEYADFAAMFKGRNYNASQWADLFAKSGARYVVITSKHHDGFALWPSKQSWMWNSKDVGPHIDIIGTLKQAVESRGIKFGTYYSLYEWFNPLYLDDINVNSSKTLRNYYVKVRTNIKTFLNSLVGQKTKMRPELQSLVETYQPSILWTDGDWDQTDEYWESKQFLTYLYNESPVRDTVVVNDRWGKGTPCRHGGFWNCKDHFLPNMTMPHKWENAFSLDKKSWGYRANINSEDVFTLKELISEVIQTVSMNGNVLINVGPSDRGVIPAITEDRLLGLGRWLAINGKAIYETIPYESVSRDLIHDNIWFTQSKDGSSVFAMGTDIDLIRRNSLVMEGVVFKNSDINIRLLGCENTECVFPWDVYDSHVEIFLDDCQCRLTLELSFTLEMRFA